MQLSPQVATLTEREEHVLGASLAAAGLSDLSPRANVDTNLSHMFASATPYIPTVTPGSRTVVGELRRVMLPIEKILVHAFPIHEVTWPPGFKDQDFADLGGNTMHLMAVAKAMLIGMALVDWTSPRVAMCLAPGSTPEVRPEPPREIKLADFPAASQGSSAE